MPIKMPWGGEKKTLEQAQEENEELEVELSIEQKKAAIRKLKEAGVNPKSFTSWSAVRDWLRKH